MTMWSARPYPTPCWLIRPSIIGQMSWCAFCYCRFIKTNLIQKDIMAAISDSEVDELLELHIWLQHTYGLTLCMYMYTHMYICKHLYNIYGLSDQWDASHRLSLSPGPQLVSAPSRYQLLPYSSTWVWTFAPTYFMPIFSEGSHQCENNQESSRWWPCKALGLPRQGRWWRC